MMQDVTWPSCKSTNNIISLQVAQNRVKVATDGSFCEDTTFVQPLLKIFLFTLRLRSRYLKGTPELALYASKKKSGPYGAPIGLYWRKSDVYDDLKNEAKIGLEISDKSFFFEVKFFSKCSKKFSIGHIIMFKVCKRCLQPCSLRQKKNYGRTISTSKYIQKSWPSLPPQGGGGNSFNATLT